MRTVSIPLSHGKCATIDAADFPLIERYSWRAERDPKNGNWYARTTINRRPVGMHRIILGASKHDLIDHRDGDGLNNRRLNLRRASHSQNGANRRHQLNNTSGFRGVSFHRASGKWQARIKVNQRSRYLGLFIRAVDAARAYDEAAQALFGDFARLNFEADESPGSGAVVGRRTG